MQARPFWISLLAMAAAVIGALALIGAVGWLAASDTLVLLPRLHGAERFVAVVMLAIGVLEVALAWGLWRLRAWAWTLGVGLEVAAILLAVLQLGRGVPGSHVATIVLATIVLWYLSRPHVRSALNA